MSENRHGSYIDQIRAHWPSSRRALWTREVLSEFMFRDESKQFLATVGLPVGETWTLSFGPTHLTRLEDVNRAVVIGYDAHVPVCIRDAADDFIYCLHEEPEFMNSTVTELGIFLLLYSEYRIAVRGIDDEETALRMIDTVESEMRKQDPAALAKVEHYWPQVLDQMKIGNL